MSARGTPTRRSVSPALNVNDSYGHLARRSARENLVRGTLVPNAAAKNLPFDRPPARTSRTTHSRIEMENGAVTYAIGPNGPTPPRGRQHLGTPGRTLVPSVVYYGGTPDERFERVRPVPESKRHYAQAGASGASAERRVSTGRRRSESPAARTSLSLSELCPAPAPARALSPHPTRAHERPSPNLPRGMGHKRRVPGNDRYDDAGMRIVAEKPRGLGYAPEPQPAEPVSRRGRVFDAAAKAPTQEQLAAMATVKRRHPPPTSDKYLLTANEYLPRAEYASRVTNATPTRRSASPFRGAANRCSSPNILAWDA
uniref:Uncharacterized protein n=1 Tax=Neobodo designis TaxID=312471 RepID=A0A7S1M2W9_NEODS|eukprot:CAMPEP_0174865786 /NCGR_PEP_ID=MMETSP1114-20130205/60976_1 /TAXON_ID=312471 /ORGANISM="Neobodo designis, Strain CCAP 1951/1" /LENGTH=312 /DNA_ID=CAMNT_0016100921 /DNA_START=66 /DNA_END=1004 /DNA_ORIENTATION=+